MGRIFGTDGARGIANTELTCELAMSIGRSAAFTLTRHNKHKAKILIGKDTRISGDMLESALAAGMCSMGADVVLVGVIPTPAVAFLVRKLKADAGVVISASHNPMEFNGIKLFSSEGYKLPDDIENEIESYILDHPEKLPLESGDVIGRVSRYDHAVEDYVSCIRSFVDCDLSGLTVAIDCANGAAVEPARSLFTGMGARCVFTADSPDGINVNAGVGSTHLENIKKTVADSHADIGIAFDGDADRCLAVDENGKEIDGDKIIAIFAEHLKEQGKLSRDTVVVTVMTNLGFIDFCRRRGIKAVRTAVGDRYVLEEMRSHGYCLGGEQSGHIILGDYATTGDGEMTAALLLSILKQSGKKASALAEDLVPYPQILVNVRTTNEGKQRFRDDEELQGFIEAQQQELFDTGRVLVRLSGTEPLIRVMVEGRDSNKIEEIAHLIENKIIERISLK